VVSSIQAINGGRWQYLVVIAVELEAVQRGQGRQQQIGQALPAEAGRDQLANASLHDVTQSDSRQAASRCA
jgi:hypothetical protein